MSTRCNIVVRDEYNAIQLYRHCDGYPAGEHGVIATLKQALPFAWELPRYEADDFAAAIVRAWKERGGDVYIDGTYEAGKTEHGDIQYLYFIEQDKDTRKLMVSVGGWQGEIGVDTYDKTDPKS